MQLDYSIEAFKEPRGFLKILQWLFAICAFATTVNFSTSFSFDVTCKNQTYSINQKVEYPFALDHQSQTIPSCDEQKVPFVGNAKSDAEFFVTTGVLCFLYATAIIALYVFADKVYMESNKLPMIDFFVTLVFAVFWLSGSAAWAKGCATMQKASDPADWIHNKHYSPCASEGIACSNPHPGSFSGIIISILFGFINFVLWSANLWFLYKETTWFESIMKNTSMTNAAAASTSSPST